MKLSEENRIYVQNMYGLFSDLGALRELPGDMQESAGFLMRVYTKLVIENPRWPQRGKTYDGFLTSRYFSALVSGQAPRKGNNIAALCAAFSEWYTPQQEQALISAFYARFPELKPKQIAKPSNKIEGWPDSEIRDQYQKVKELFGNEKGGSILNLIPASGNYCARIINEHQKRFPNEKKEF